MSKAASPLQARLDAARKELLDLGLRNPMLNYRPTKARGVVLVDELPDELWRRLVVEQKACSFLAAEGEREEGWLGADDAAAPAGERAARHTDTRLQTALTPGPLQTVLLNTFYAARSFIEEQGANVLYLALGMLEWQEADKPDLRRAPLLLVPVELSRTSALSRFSLRWTGEDPGDNLSLAAKLRTEFGLELPPLPAAEDLDPLTWFGEVAQAVASRGWRVDASAAVIGFFAFGKYLMYRDLDAEAWPADMQPAGHPTLAALLDTGFREPPAELTEDDDLDASLPPDVPAAVVDMDGSQALAVLAVRAGRNIVIQGPPGTGKSQTITNLIADAIARGRTVLFVAEKLAALEVVKRRLDGVGLGDACLELHSHKTSKKAVLEELQRTGNQGRPRVPLAAADDEGLRVELRDRLNAYAQAANLAIGESGVTPHTAVGELLALYREAPDARLPEAAVPGDMRTWPGAVYKRRAGLIDELVARLRDTGPIARHPYRGARLTALAPGHDAEVREAVKAARAATTALAAAIAPLALRLGMPAPATRDGAMSIVLAADRALRGPDLTGVKVADRHWLARQGRLQALMDAGNRLTALQTEFGGQVVPGAWDQDLTLVRSAIAAHGQRFILLRWLSGDWRRAMATLKGLAMLEPPRTHAARLALLDGLSEGRAHRATIAREDGLARDLFEGPWAGPATDWAALTRINDWVHDLHEEVAEGRLPEGLLAFLAAQPRGLREAPEAGPAAAALDGFDAAWARVAGRLEWSPPAEAAAVAASAFADLEARLDRWFLAPESLQALAAFNRLAATLGGEGLGAIAAGSASGDGDPEQLPAAFARAWHEALLDRALRERPALAQFDGAGHGLQRDRFADLDRLVVAHTRVKLAARHWEQVPRGEGGGQWAILRREMEKRARHLPIRQLMTKAGHAVQAIKPVFMMSPLSVATFLPPGGPIFDLVIFDEASQVKPVDAFGPILRANQVVVVGDKRQMPPTSFFDGLAGNADFDEDPDAAATGDFESVLGLFEAQGAPQHMLRWHYRSKHESLIAVSNTEFYDGRLVVFPSPDADRADAGLRFRFLPTAVYDRGGSRSNVGEAEAVAEAVLVHARTTPGLSLGVAAFSVAQADAIQAAVEKRRRAEPDAEAFFAAHPLEPFFVKNLETVQGDERDVVYVSVGYGRDAEGKVALNFGPLNREGGERRLNVLITRARWRCEVFSSIRADDVRLTAGEPRGIASLRRFLRYAETGVLDGPGGPVVQPAPTAFAAEVAAALEAAGWEVVRGVGTEGGTIDVAVRDPQHAGRYLMGVLCDGPVYGAARSARDRDRLREQVLDGLGWRLAHAWSMDWLRRPDHERRKLVALVEAAAAAPVEESPLEAAGAGVAHAREAVAFERDPEITGTTGPQRALIAPYRFAEPKVVLNGRDVQAMPINVIAGWVAEVVSVEGPVHLAEIVRRLATAGDVKRPGPRFRTAVEEAVAFAERMGIARRGEFVWASEMAVPPLRDRGDLPATARKPEWVCDEEVQAAVARAVADALGLAPAQAATEGLKLLGFARPSEAAKARGDEAVAALLAAGRLVRRGETLIVGD